MELNQSKQSETEDTQAWALSYIFKKHSTMNKEEQHMHYEKAWLAQISMPWTAQ